MKILLLTDVSGHGKKGDIIDVNDGYARNFLIPKKMAVEATKAVINEHNFKIQREQRLLEQEKEKAMELYRLLSGKTVDVKVRCGEGKMYGSVTTQDIANGLALLGITVDKKKITIKEPSKTLGQHEIEVWVYKETVAKVKINVLSDKA